MSSVSAAFRSILHMPAEEAAKFCTSHNLTPFTVYEEPARVIVPDTMKDTPNRVELQFYLDASDTYRVATAIIYKDGVHVAVVEPDECDECGGECDGVHARVASTAAPTTEKEKRVKELTDTILKNEQTIVNEVVRQMDAARVRRIVEVLSVQDPDVVTEVISRLKEASKQSKLNFTSTEDMKQTWKSYGK